MHAIGAVLVFLYPAECTCRWLQGRSIAAESPSTPAHSRRSPVPPMPPSCTHAALLYASTASAPAPRTHIVAAAQHPSFPPHVHPSSCPKPIHPQRGHCSKRWLAALPILHWAREPHHSRSLCGYQLHYSVGSAVSPHFVTRAVCDVAPVQCVFEMPVWDLVYPVCLHTLRTHKDVSGSFIPQWVFHKASHLPGKVY